MSFVAMHARREHEHDAQVDARHLLTPSFYFPDSQTRKSGAAALASCVFEDADGNTRLVSTLANTRYINDVVGCTVDEGGVVQQRVIPVAVLYSLVPEHERRAIEWILCRHAYAPIRFPRVAVCCEPGVTIGALASIVLKEQVTRKQRLKAFLYRLFCASQQHAPGSAQSVVAHVRFVL